MPRAVGEELEQRVDARLVRLVLQRELERQAVAAQLALQVEWEAAVTVDVDALLSTLKRPDVTLSVLEIDEIVEIETAQAQKKALARANMMQTQPD